MRCEPGQFWLIFIFFLLLLGQPPLAAAARFVDNGDGTVTDTVRNVMWQKGDNGKEVTFEEAAILQEPAAGSTFGLASPKPDERDTAAVIELMMKSSRDVYANFDLYWSSDPTVMIPFNYRPSQGGPVSRAYPARPGPGVREGSPRLGREP